GHSIRRVLRSWAENARALDVAGQARSEAASDRERGLRYALRLTMLRPLSIMTLPGGPATLRVAAGYGGQRDKQLDAPYAIRRATSGALVACLCDGAGSWGEGLEASRDGARVATTTCAEDPLLESDPTGALVR